MKIAIRACLTALAAGGLVQVPAQASFHTFVVNEVYSNASGTVQFIEMREGSNSDFQSFWTGENIASTTNTLTFTHDLPDTSTANKYALLATPGFASFAGVTPDYTMPVNFFNTVADTLTWGGFFDS